MANVFSVTVGQKRENEDRREPRKAMEAMEEPSCRDRKLTTDVLENSSNDQQKACPEVTRKTGLKPTQVT